MQIKAAEPHEPDIVALEALLDRPDVPTATRKRIEDEIRRIRAGERAEHDATYQIELYFGRSSNWMTIHDLRIEVDGLVAQMDHLLVNRFAEVWVCESKSFAEGVSINEHGEWSRWWHGHAEGIPSPIEQNRRHIHLLQRVFDDGLVPLPRRLGLAPMKPRLRSLVLISDNARISRPRRKIDGLDEVIKAEQLRTRLIDVSDPAGTLDIARVIGKERLERFARDLAALHRPAAFDWASRFGLTAASAPGAAAPSVEARAQSEPSPVPGPVNAPRRPWLVKFDGPCSGCGRLLVKGTPAVWNHRQRKMYCSSCDPG